MSNKKLGDAIRYLKKKKRVLFITTSNRWSGSKDVPKSTILAYFIADQLKNVKIIDVTKLKIYSCEGNNSEASGNDCGVRKAVLKDKLKNPSGYHRCWASINNKDDGLWKISKELFESDVIVFFGSVRWGQMNAYYQKLIERLNWIQSMWATHKDENTIKNIDAGLICIGQNWNELNVVKTQKKVLGYFGFKTPKELFWSWQYTKNINDESQESYKKAFDRFMNEFNIDKNIYPLKLKVINNKNNIKKIIKILLYLIY
ncbi:MAG: hypothetical protein AABW91_00820 [Nanoarchaeota archaeon]